jgi:hypothetical protein
MRGPRGLGAVPKLFVLFACAALTPTAVATGEPSTMAPTSSTPSTADPITGSPTTHVPTTAVPSNESPTPTTQIPSVTLVPTTGSPTTHVPTTAVPSNAVETPTPTTQIPSMTLVPTTTLLPSPAPSSTAPSFAPTSLPSTAVGHAELCCAAAWRPCYNRPYCVATWCTALEHGVVCCNSVRCVRLADYTGSFAGLWLVHYAVAKRPCRAHCGEALGASGRVRACARTCVVVCARMRV